MTAPVAGSSAAKPAAMGQPPPPPPKPTQPVVSFRSVLLGDSAPGSEPLGEDASTQPELTLSSLLAGNGGCGSLWAAMPLPKEAPPSAAVPTATAAEGQLAPDMDLDSLSRAAGTAHDDPLDPVHRQRAAAGSASLWSPDVALAQPGMSMPTGAPPEVVRAQASLEDLLPNLVRRVQWSGDGRKGTVRMELAGSMAGSTLVVSADAGRVRVQLDVPPGVDASGWQQRITERLAAKNIPTDGVEVT